MDNGYISLDEHEQYLGNCEFKHRDILSDPMLQEEKEMLFPQEISDIYTGYRLP